MKHTELPWHISGTYPEYLHIGSKNSAMVLASMNNSHMLTPANAELIVRAVNCHAKLVKHLEIMTENFASALPDHCNADWYEEYNDAMAVLNEAKNLT